MLQLTTFSGMRDQRQISVEINISSCVTTLRSRHSLIRTLTYINPFHDSDFNLQTLLHLVQQAYAVCVLHCADIMTVGFGRCRWRYLHCLCTCWTLSYCAQSRSTQTRTAQPGRRGRSIWDREHKWRKTDTQTSSTVCTARSSSSPLAWILVGERSHSVKRTLYVVSLVPSLQRKRNG